MLERWTPRPLFLVLCLTLSLALNWGLAGVAGAQPHPTYPDVRLARLDYSNASGEEGATYFHYDRYGVLRVSFWTLLDGSRFSRGRHLYDDAGRQVRKLRAFSDSLTSVEEFSYDPGGLLIGEIFSRSDGKSGSARYEWDGQGRLLKMMARQHKGWLRADIEFHHGPGPGGGPVMTDAIMTREGEPLGTITYTHAADGHLERAHWDFAGRWSQTFGYVWEPIPAVCHAAANPLQQQNTRYRVVHEDYDWNNGENGGPSTYRYGPDGRLLEKVFSRADGLTTTTTYQYGDRGDLMSSHRSYHDGRSADFTYRHDEQGRLVEKTFIRSDGARGRELYRYDPQGLLSTMEYENMDFWLNGTVSLDYDAGGRPTGGTFRGRDGYDAALTLNTDDRGNVTKIHWDFDFGKTQTYLFTYERVSP